MKEVHREAVVKLAAKGSSTHVGAQLNAQHLLDKKHHQCMLAKLLSSMFFGLSGTTATWAP